MMGWRKWIGSGDVKEGSGVAMGFVVGAGSSMDGGVCFRKRPMGELGVERAETRAASCIKRGVSWGFEIGVGWRGGQGQ